MLLGLGGKKQWRFCSQCHSPSFRCANMKQEECVPSGLGPLPCSDMNWWGPPVCLRANKNEVIVLKKAQGPEQSSSSDPLRAFHMGFWHCSLVSGSLVGPHLGHACAQLCFMCSTFSGWFLPRGTFLFENVCGLVSFYVAVPPWFLPHCHSLFQCHLNTAHLTNTSPEETIHGNFLFKLGWPWRSPCLLRAKGLAK